MLVKIDPGTFGNITAAMVADPDGVGIMTVEGATGWTLTAGVFSSKPSSIANDLRCISERLNRLADEIAEKSLRPS